MTHLKIERKIIAHCLKSLKVCGALFFILHGRSVGAQDRAPASVTKAVPAIESPLETPAPNGWMGDWGGLKTHLADVGLDVNLFYRIKLVSNLAGGLEQSSGVLGNVDLTLDFDLEKSAELRGLKFWAYGLGNHGADPTTYVGDSFATSNIQAPDTFKLYEIFIKENFSSQLSTLVGLRDLNADFYVAESSKLFLNGAFGISQVFAQTGIPGPSIFPQAAVAFTAHYQGAERIGPEGASVYVSAGVFNAQSGHANRPYGTQINTSFSDGVLLIAEAGLQERSSIDTNLKYGIGFWHYTKDAVFLDQSEREKTNEGFYFLLDQPLGHGFAAFAKYGCAPEEINIFKNAIEAGLNWNHPFGRALDAIGIGVIHATTGSAQPGASHALQSESAVEFVYKINLDRGIDLKPDLQYVIHPGLGAVPDATVGTLEISVQF